MIDSPRVIRLRVPGSKSETQRALIVTALAAGRSLIRDPLDCDDSRVLRTALRACGVSINEEPRSWSVQAGPLRAPPTALHCGDAGSALRFLAPLALVVEGELLLDGSARLRERPLAELLAALRSLGASVRYLEAAGRLPLGLLRSDEPGDRVAVDLTRSSQFASGLLLAAPRLDRGLCLELLGRTVSRPYLDLTLRMMRDLGAGVEEEGRCLRVAASGYRPGELQVGGDWSSAAFLLAASAISGREVELEGVAPDSGQGDRVIVELLAELARPGPHRFDLTDCPDLLPPLAAAAALGEHRAEIVGIAHARLKESDRPHVLATGLLAAGLRVVEAQDRLELEPGGTLRPVRLDPAGDHRMAMAFGLLSLREPGIQIEDPQCVSKSYPGFWEHLERFR